MPRVFLVFLTFFWLPLAVAALPPAADARAGSPVFEPFDARPLTAAEARLLQTALAVTGDYRGALDGVWGPVSQDAIDAYAVREFGGGALNVHAAALVLALRKEVEASGWDFRHDPDLGISLALPSAVLGPEQSEEGGRRWWSRTGTLTVLTHRFDAAEAAAWHEAAAAGARPSTLHTFRARDLMITDGELEDGRAFHVRSDLVAGGWATAYVAAGSDEATLMNLMVASIRPGPPVTWDLPENGRLTWIVAETATLLGGTDGGSLPMVAGSPESAAMPHELGMPASTGTGFYVGARTLVTAAHVVRDCLRVALPDGTDLAVVAADRDLDVAVLEAPAPAHAWLALASGDRVRLGQRLHAAGFPYYSIAGTSLHLTGGNVSALAGVDDDRRFFSFTAPVQPGNSGGPVIGPGGTVLGVAIARLSESFIAETTGSLPQNVNYALSNRELVAFLQRVGRAPAVGGLAGFDMEAGAPDGFEAAVVPVVCE